MTENLEAIEENATEPRYGARVFQHSDGVILVKQTVKRGTRQNDPYTIDEQRERFVNPDDDIALAQAVRAALAGEL
jgi:hypothetical protein